MLLDSIVFGWLQLPWDGCVQYWRPLPLKKHPNIGFPADPKGTLLGNEKLEVYDF